MAAELALRGWTVDLPRRGQRGIDLYAYDVAQKRTCGIQVKTRGLSSKDFRFDPGLLEPAARTADEWVVLVALAPPFSRSEFYVVPRSHVTAAMLTYAQGRSDKGAGWTARYLGPQEFTKYHERWDLMDRSAIEADWLMPSWVNIKFSAERETLRDAGLD